MNDITNYFAITDTLGTSGQPTREQFQQIAASGYQAVINLAMPNSDRAIGDEGSIVTSLGMSYYHIPVPFDAPSADHLREFVGAMRALEGRKVWVHCVVNYRVSAFVYKYLRDVKGFDEERAASPLLKQWRANMDERWQAFLNLSL